MAGTTSTLLLALAGLVTCQAPGRPREAGVPVPAVGDHVALALDDEDGVVTKVAGGWISVKLDDRTVEKFRSTELRY